MKDLTATAPEKLEAKDILAIPETDPELLFKRDLPDIKARFREIARIWHPDHRPGDPNAPAVLARIMKLRDVANDRFSAGTWRSPSKLEFTDIKTGRFVSIKYAKKRDFELGEMYISHGFVTFAVKKEYADLFDNGVKHIGGLGYANDKMRKECERYVPQMHSTHESADRLFLVLKKNPELVLLADLQEHVGGKIEPTHTAWIMSTLHNAACYLEYSGLAHNGISADTYFVDPAGHTGALLGGWWYAAKAGQSLKGLPSATLDIVPPDVLSTGKADARADLMLIRGVGRSLLGDFKGMRLPRDKTVPKPIADWLTLPPMDDARADYKQWMNSVLPKSFGARRYVKMELQYSDIYKP